MGVAVVDANRVGHNDQTARRSNGAFCFSLECWIGADRVLDVEMATENWRLSI